MRDPHEHLLHELVRAPVDAPANTPVVLREALIAGGAVPSELEPYVEVLRRHAYRITDGMIADLGAEGHSEEEIFEITVCAALHEALRRLEIGLRVMEGTA